MAKKKNEEFSVLDITPTGSNKGRNRNVGGLPVRPNSVLGSLDRTEKKNRKKLF